MEIEQVVSQLTALAQESRLRVFRALVQAGEKGLCAGDLSRTLEVAKPTMSFHLKELVNAGLLNSQKNGRSITYMLKVDAVRGLFDFLLQDCCQGRPELCAPGKKSDCCEITL